MTPFFAKKTFGSSSCQMDLQEQTSIKFQSVIINFPSRIFIWKCYLQISTILFRPQYFSQVDVFRRQGNHRESYLIYIRIWWLYFSWRMESICKHPYHHCWIHKWRLHSAPQRILNKIDILQIPFIKCIFMKENVWILIRISLDFIRSAQISAS